MRRGIRAFALIAGLMATGSWAATGPTPAIALTWAEIGIAALKFVGVAVGTVSTLWGLTQKLTFDDPDGGKRLTRQGRVAFGLAVGSFLVAGAAASVELISTNIRKQNQLIADAAHAAAEAEKARATAEANARTERRLFEAQALAQFNEARRQADSAAQRLLALETAAREERRDAALALQVGQGTAANLARTQAALGELERVLQPLGFPVMGLEWHARGNTPEMVAMLAEVERIASRARAGEPAILDALEIPRMTPEYSQKIASIVIKPGSPLYPGLSTTLREVVSLERRGMMLTPASAGTELPAVLATQGQRLPLGQRGDIRFTFDIGAPLLTYHIDRKLLVFTSTWRPTSWINQTGNIVSIPDLEKATIVIDPGPTVPDRQRNAGLRNALRDQIVPFRLIIAANGRRFTVDSDQFRRLATRDGHPLYVVDTVGPARYPRGLGEAQFGNDQTNVEALRQLESTAH